MGLSKKELLDKRNIELIYSLKNTIDTVVINEEIGTWIFNEEKKNPKLRCLCVSELPINYHGKAPNYYSQALVLKLVQMINKGELIFKED